MISPEYKRLPAEKLIPYARNSRTHSQEQVAQIAASIKEFGFTNPILIDEENGIIAGHGRLLAAQKLGIEEVPVIVMHGLTDAQKKAYVIADNKLALNAGWDDEMLRVEFMELREMGFDLELTGFSLDEIAGLQVQELEEGLTDEDAVPDAPETPVTVLGDVWQLGDHRVMCGSSTDAHSVEMLLSGQMPNTMITDPPYGVEYDSGWRADRTGMKKTAREETATLKNDNNADWYDAYALFPGNVAYVWHASAFTDVVMDGLRRAGFEIKSQIIWNKNVHALSRSDYQWKHEPCWYAIKKGANHNWKGDRTQKTIWDVQNVIFEKGAGGKTSHPTQKPVELYMRSINNHTNPGEYVYEPFGGSGSAVISCEKTGRRSLTMELDEKFVDVIINRWQDFTGRLAVHAATGKTFEEMRGERLTPDSLSVNITETKQEEV